VRLRRRAWEWWGASAIVHGAFCLAWPALAQEPVPQQSTTGPVPPPQVGLNLLSPGGQNALMTTISGVPPYLWRHGCGPTAVGMVLGYYDLNGFPDLFVGDASSQTASVNQGIASQGSGTRGAGMQLHYEDYALPNDSSSSSVISDSSQTYPTGCHASDSIADFMRTSWSSAGNFYGWSWSSDIMPAFTNYARLKNPSYVPRSTSYYMDSSLTWTVVTNEIANNRPMVFLVDSSGDGFTDHFVPVIGYSDGPPQQYACYDTWDTNVRWCQFRAMSSSYSWGVWGGWSFSLAVANKPPTNIVISNTNVLENLAAGTMVGAFTTEDPDTGNTFSYTLVAGTGSEDNGSFTISGNNLLTGDSFNYEVKSNYSIRVQATDQGGLSTQKVFAISVTDVNETPAFLGLDAITGTNVVFRWSSVTNHMYTVRYSTNLMSGFSVLKSNITATPVVNMYTDSVQGVLQKFWQITTAP
jgi:hypothetical protein